MLPTQLPSTFCWTKMGTESGEGLEMIVRRKEWERRLGNGVFLWGIGQSLGANASRATSNGQRLDVVFSPMQSKPKEIDVEPGELVLWTAWTDDAGQTWPLPRHTFVTSRATLPSGRRKESHYALVCNTNQPLSTASGMSVALHTLRNFGTGKALGASQVSAVVAYDPSEGNVQGKIYPVSFTAQLASPYFVRLAEPTVLDAATIKEADAICRMDDIENWGNFVRRLRISANKPVANYTPDMFRSSELLHIALMESNCALARAA